MNKIVLFSGKLFFLFSFLTATLALSAEDFMGNLFPQTQINNKSRKKGPTIINADTMDMDMKNNLITLIDNVVVDDPENKLTADKMLIYLKEGKGGESKKELKAIVALGNVVMSRKALTDEDKKAGRREARSGRADYDAASGIIIMTENPVLYQGDNYMKGDTITLWKNSDRMKIEGNRSSGKASHIVISQSDDTDVNTDTNSIGIKLGI